VAVAAFGQCPGPGRIALLSVDGKIRCAITPPRPPAAPATPAASAALIATGSLGWLSRFACSLCGLRFGLVIVVEIDPTVCDMRVGAVLVVSSSGFVMSGFAMTRLDHSV
jgi:hypothetical protein